MFSKLMLSTVADYDPIDDLNAIFSHPSTLSSAPTVYKGLQAHQNGLDRDIGSLVATQSSSDSNSVARVQSAKAELAVLLKKIEDVRQRALETEQAITEMTADIKRLDGTKRNLTLSMTALKRLQMLTTAYEQLRGLGKSRQYRECAQLLGAVIQLMAHFKSYRSIDQIATLGRKVADLQRELLEQVCEDFELAFTRGEVAQKKGTLFEACLVLDALGDNARSRLITWYCNSSLREYRQIFKATDEAGSLDNISRRFAWFNRALKTYDIEHSPVFPQYWRVNEMLANSFCSGTRDDFRGILERSTKRAEGPSLDVNLLLSCLQETLDFEHSLERRFAVGQSRTSTDTTSSEQEKALAFEQAISEAFEPYLSLWVESQDRQLASLIPKYRQQPVRNLDEDFTPQLVIPSSTELFQFYRLTLAQCAKLSTGASLLDLSKTFAKYLDQYSQQILFYFLGDRPGPQGPSIEEIIVILNTADYCYTTCAQLEEKIRARIDEEHKASVDLQSQGDTFMGIAGAAIRALVRKVQLNCEPGWREMRNTNWGQLENVGDQSSYVAELLRSLNETSTGILKFLHKQQYARAFCDNLVDDLTYAYINNIPACRPISEVGAEQMLLDFYIFKKAFLDLPSLAGGSQPLQAQTAYAKRVAIATAKLDPLLKTLQVRPSPPEALVQAYLIHIADSSEANFRKILELKGVSAKREQAQLVELFNAHRASPSQASNLVASSPLLTPLAVPAGVSAAQQGGAALASAVTSNASTLAGAKFDPSSFGNALLNAARDGVDRFGTPSNPLSSTGPSRVASPPHGETGPMNLNDNLRNIGKFFRRDTSGFGRLGQG